MGWVACDLAVSGRPGPSPQCARTLLQTATRRLVEGGMGDLKTGVELEFHLLNPTSMEIADQTDCSRKPCYEAASLMNSADFVCQLVESMEQLDYLPYQADHEDSIGQFEINWEYDHALKTADKQTFFKFMVRQLAQQHGMRATFMPKPIGTLTGNSSHVHTTLHDPSTGCNLFKDANAPMELSASALGFLGGLLEHSPAVCAVSNPTINSYKRINAATTASGSTWAPNTVSWTGNNRTHMVRVPDAPRLEFRLPDGASHPYLLPAAIATAGADGIQSKLDPGPPNMLNMYLPGKAQEEAKSKMTKLPTSLPEALSCLEADAALVEGLGEEMVSAYVALRREQCADFSQTVSQWELDNTLDA